MTDGRNVPPTLGTEPRVHRSQGRRYREEPGIYHRYRQQGSHAYTLDEIDARIMACAEDEASRDGVGVLEPALFRELEGIFWHRLYRDLPDENEQLAGHNQAAELAEVRVSAARENHRRLERERRELESRRMRMARPPGGLMLTQKWFLAVCLAPAALIEVIGSTPSIQEAFKLGRGWSILFAVAISMILVLAAEQLGNSLGSFATRSRRRAGVIVGLVLALAMAAGIVTIVSLAESRETNLSFRDAVQSSRDTRNESGRIGAAGPAENAGSEAVAADAPTEPDFEFFIPLSVFVLAASMLVALRVEMARDHNRLNDDIQAAGAGAQEQREVAEEENEAAVQSREVNREVIVGLAAHVEQERNLLDIWLARFEAEYGRFCAAGARHARPVVTPNLPNAAAIIMQLLNPEFRANRTADAESGPADRSTTNGDGSRGHPPPDGNGAGPGQSNSGPEAEPAGTPAPDDDPPTAREPPVPPRDVSDSSQRRGHGPDGRPDSVRWRERYGSNDEGD